MDRLQAMRAFRKVVELGSFSGAAQHLQLSPASVSKYMNYLENHLGAALLARTTRRMSLTDVGRDYYERCVHILDDIEQAEALAGRSRQAARGPLKVRAPVSLGAAELGKTVAEFLTRYPEITVELTLNDRFTDPLEEGYDVALRIVTGMPDSTLVARPIAVMPRLLCAAPAYLRRCGRPAAPADLGRHNCIVYTRGETPEEWRFTGAEGARTVRVRGNYRCNLSIVLREALLEGAGIGLLPAFIVEADIAAGRLAALLPQWTPQPRTLFAVFARRRHPLPKITAFVDFIAGRFPGSTGWLPPA
jgi:DNA-binding transcriptional LysR family regulator